MSCKEFTAIHSLLCNSNTCHDKLISHFLCSSPDQPKHLKNLLKHIEPFPVNTVLTRTGHMSGFNAPWGYPDSWSQICWRVPFGPWGLFPLEQLKWRSTWYDSAGISSRRVTRKGGKVSRGLLKCASEQSCTSHRWVRAGVNISLRAAACARILSEIHVHSRTESRRCAASQLDAVYPQRLNLLNYTTIGAGID